MKKNLETMRHSCSHVLAAAVLKLYPGAKLGIGPAIEKGFYYDFEFSKSINEEDFSKISDLMNQIIKEGLPFKKEEVSISEAKKLFKNQPYKLELISDLEKEGTKEVSVYKTGDFLDLCAGPHVKDTSQIGPFKLLSLAGAYWRGSEKNPMLTRIYGTCFPTQKELNAHLQNLKEAEERDHRLLGKRLELFSISEEVGGGLPIWHPKGAVIRQIIEDFWKKEHQARGYEYVYSPHIGSINLWKRSGHWDFYRENMYAPIVIENQKFLLKPMNCPFHVQIYKSKIRSYRNLPLRLCELGTVYRFERAGVLHGLVRVRGFTQDDAHIFCRPDQLEEEIVGVLDLALFMLSTFGFKDYEIDLSVRDPKNKEKYLGADKIWQKAEKALEEALKKKKLKFHRAEGEAIFYGPKIDIKLLDSLGRGWQGPTIQVDFNFPEKFNLTFINQKGEKEPVVMIHRTVLGSMERFIGTLIEQYAGAFPVWLAPVQAVVIPITDKQGKYGQEVAEKLKKEEIRAKLDDRDETTSAKIRDAELEKIPYMIVVGEKEVKAKNISVRQRGEKDLGKMTLERFLDKIKTEIENKSLS